ncbi:hypothetical protein B0H19DRAFT_1374005, partial [Mycena capillaripes]
MITICENCGHCNSRYSSAADDRISDNNASSSSSDRLRSQLAVTRAAILRQKASFDALEKKRQALEVELGRIVYPVMNLPPENFSKIFVDCLPSHGRVRPSPATAPLSLAQICQHWREIALSSCKLWSSLDLLSNERWIPAADAAQSPQYGALLLLETWFARAKGHPLSVTIRSPHMQIPPAIISLMSSAAGQLYSLELDLSREDFRSFGQDGITFPILKRLAIFSDDSSVEDGIHRICENAPFLSELRMDRSGVIAHVYPSLTRIELRKISFSGLLEIMNLCSRLRYLTVTCVDDKDQAWPDGSIDVCEDFP